MDDGIGEQFGLADIRARTSSTTSLGVVWTNRAIDGGGMLKRGEYGKVT